MPTMPSGVTPACSGGTKWLIEKEHVPVIRASKMLLVIGISAGR
jgi:hypothetical protein